MYVDTVHVRGNSSYAIPRLPWAQEPCQQMWLRDAASSRQASRLMSRKKRLGPRKKPLPVVRPHPPQTPTIPRALPTTAAAARSCITPSPSRLRRRKFQTTAMEVAPPKPDRATVKQAGEATDRATPARYLSVPAQAAASPSSPPSPPPGRFSSTTGTAVAHVRVAACHAKQPN